MCLDTIRGRTTAGCIVPCLVTLQSDLNDDLLLCERCSFKSWQSSHMSDIDFCLQVKKLLARGNLDLAQANLDREGEVAEIKNQIAIIRYSHALACNPPHCILCLCRTAFI